jgi:hypothetical protein
MYHNLPRTSAPAAALVIAPQNPLAVSAEEAVGTIALHITDAAQTSDSLRVFQTKTKLGEQLRLHA